MSCYGPFWKALKVLHFNCNMNCNAYFKNVSLKWPSRPTESSIVLKRVIRDPSYCQMRCWRYSSLSRVYFPSWLVFRSLAVKTDRIGYDYFPGQVSYLRVTWDWTVEFGPYSSFSELGIVVNCTVVMICVSILSLTWAKGCLASGSSDFSTCSSLAKALLVSQSWAFLMGV